MAADARGHDQTRVRPGQPSEHKHEPDTPATPSRLDAAPETPDGDGYWQDVLNEPMSAEAGVEMEDTSWLYDGVDPDPDVLGDEEHLFGPESPAPDVDVDDTMGDDDMQMANTISSITDVLQTLGVDPAIAT